VCNFQEQTTTNKGQIKMVQIQHSLNFITEVDETHPVGIRLLSLPQEMQIAMLEGMLKELLAPAIQPAIDHLNENGSYAILKVAK
jgi:hypothetical protein